MSRRWQATDIGWIDRLPEDWGVSPLFAVCRQNSRSNAGLKETNLLSLSYGNVIRRDINSRDGLLPESFETYQIVEPGDIVLRLTDLQNDKKSLRTALVGERGIITSAYLSVRVTNANPRFLSYLMRDIDARKVLYSMGGGLRQSMKFDDVKRIPIQVPPWPEQEAIADFLDGETNEIDAFIRDQKELIGLLQERRAATISHAVTKGLSPDEPLKPSGSTWLGRVPVGWTIQKLGWLAAVKNGSTPSRSESKYWLEGTVPWVSSTVANLSEVVASTEFVSPLAVQECHLPTIPPGSLLVGLTGQGKTRGMVTRLRFASTINQHLAAVTLRRGLSSEYAYWVLTAAYDHLRFVSDGNGGTKGGLTCEELAALQVPVPAPETQKSIASFLEQAVADIDLAIADGRTSILLSYERRSALISAAVSGKIDVRQRVGGDW